MPPCPQCGVPHGEGARYCPSCGAALLPSAPPAPVAAQPRDTSGAQTVILIGAILAGLLPIALALFFLFFGALFSAALPFGFIPGSIFAILAVFILLAGVVFGAAGLWARNVVRDGDPQRGGMVAGVVGLVACLVGNVIGGLVLIVGGVMAYTAK